jgi:hypothetical protein
MTKQRTLSVGIALLYLSMAACTKKQADEPAPVAPVGPGGTVSYATVIGPLIDTKCAFCHAPGKSGTIEWTYTGYSSVVANAARIKDAVLVTKIMPLQGSLSAVELQSLKAWFDQGMPQ